jgi:hypothetical protein
MNYIAIKIHILNIFSTSLRRLSIHMCLQIRNQYGGYFSTLFDSSSATYLWVTDLPDALTALHLEMYIAVVGLAPSRVTR